MFIMDETDWLGGMLMAFEANEKLLMPLGRRLSALSVTGE